MVLYEADLDKIAVEVKSVSSKKSKVSKKSTEPKEPKKKVSKKRKAPSVDETLVEEPVKDVEMKIEPAPEPTPEPIPEPTPEPVAQAVAEPVTKVEPKPEKKRAPRKKRDPSEAPVWFAKYVEGVKKEQAAMKSEKIPAKKVKEEAQEAAAKSWNHGLTRNRVQNEVDSHMSRMYSMIFSK